MTTTETHCPYCSLQCGMRLAGVRTPEVGAWEEFPVNRGGLCRKGWTATGLLRHRERLTTPLVRDPATGELAPGHLGRGAGPRRHAAVRAARARTATTPSRSSAAAA